MPIKIDVFILFTFKERCSVFQEETDEETSLLPQMSHSFIPQLTHSLLPHLSSSLKTSLNPLDSWEVYQAGYTPSGLAESSLDESETAS